MIDHLVLTIPMRTVSEANDRSHWTVRNKRKQAQQKEVMAEWRHWIGMGRVNLPCRVTFTRYSTKLLDTDNLAGSMKHARDMVSKLLGVDDGPTAPVEWIYKQEKISKRQHRVQIEVESV